MLVYQGLPALRSYPAVLQTAEFPDDVRGQVHVLDKFSGSGGTSIGPEGSSSDHRTPEWSDWDLEHG